MEGRNEEVGSELTRNNIFAAVTEEKEQKYKTTFFS